MKKHLFNRAYVKVVNGVVTLALKPKNTPLHKSKLKNPLNY